MNLKDCLNIKDKELLHEGITNTSYLIDKKYVYRDKKEILDPFNKPENEKKTIDLLKDSTFVEKVIDFDIETGKKLSLYIDETERMSIHLSDKEIKNILDSIKELHSYGEVSYDFDAFERIKFYRSVVEEKVDPVIEETVLHLTSELYKRYPLVLSHNDLVRGNILLKEDKAYLIDFEFSGNNIELFDIASLLSENEFDKETKKKLLANFTFFYSIKDILTMMMFLDILWYYWGMYLYQVTKKPIFLEIAKAKFSRINNI